MARSTGQAQPGSPCRPDPGVAIDRTVRERWLGPATVRGAGRRWPSRVMSGRPSRTSREEPRPGRPPGRGRSAGPPAGRPATGRGGQSHSRRPATNPMAGPTRRSAVRLAGRRPRNAAGGGSPGTWEGEPAGRVRQRTDTPRRKMPSIAPTPRMFTSPTFRTWIHAGRSSGSQLARISPGWATVQSLAARFTGSPM